MKPITLYSTPFCGYCMAARRLLQGKGRAFAEIDVAGDPRRRAAMVQRAAGVRTVPQIFVGETHVGGFAELSALDRAGKLDPLLVA